jgi:hypothetical protein
MCCKNLKINIECNKELAHVFLEVILCTHLNDMIECYIWLIYNIISYS